jgi:hypothetical protein
LGLQDIKRLRIVHLDVIEPQLHCKLLRGSFLFIRFDDGFGFGYAFLFGGPGFPCLLGRKEGLAERWSDFAAIGG